MVFSLIASKLSSSLMGLLDTPGPALQKEPGVQDIREAMFVCMDSRVGKDMRQHVLWTKVTVADNVQTLWYLRMDLMTVLSVHCDETVARSELEQITTRFKGLLPRSQMKSSRKPGRTIN